MAYRTTIAAAVLSAIAFQPVSAQSLIDSIDNEDIGHVVGGIGGAVLGSQFGKGKGKTAATAAGAIGGLLLGGAIGREADSRSTVDLGSAPNPIATPAPVYTPVYSAPQPQIVSTSPRRAAPQRPAALPALSVPPALLPLDADYVATTRSNVRGGPGTDYVVVGGLAPDERVRALGKVDGRDWTYVSLPSGGVGYVYSSLLRPAPVAAAAIREETPRVAAPLRETVTRAPGDAGPLVAGLAPGMTVDEALAALEADFGPDVARFDALRGRVTAEEGVCLDGEAELGARCLSAVFSNGPTERATSIHLAQTVAGDRRAAIEASLIDRYGEPETVIRGEDAGAPYEFLSWGPALSTDRDGRLDALNAPLRPLEALIESKGRGTSLILWSDASTAPVSAASADAPVRF